MRSGLAELYLLVDSTVGIMTHLLPDAYQKCSGHKHPLHRSGLTPESLFFLCSWPKMAGQKVSASPGEPV